MQVTAKAAHKTGASSTQVQMFRLENGELLHNVEYKMTGEDSFGLGQSYIRHLEYVRSRKQLVLQRGGGRFQVVSLTTTTPQFHPVFGQGRECLLGATILHVVALAVVRDHVSLYSFGGQQLANIALQLQPALSSLLGNVHLETEVNDMMIILSPWESEQPVPVHVLSFV